MNKSLLDRVSVEKTRVLADVLRDVVFEMISIERNQDLRLKDEVYCICLSLEHLVCKTIEQQSNNIQGE